METIDLVKFSRSLEAYQSCVKSNNTDWQDKHKDYIETECKKLPHGSGLDAGVEFDFDASTPLKLVFRTSFHHLDENGYYSGWSDHSLIISPEFGYYHIKITGKDRNQIKDYLSQLFYEVFTVKSI